MADDDRSRDALLRELAELRRQVAELKKAVAEPGQVEGKYPKAGAQLRRAKEATGASGGDDESVHDLNNLLAGICLHAHSLKRASEPGNEAYSAAGAIEHAVRRATELVARRFGSGRSTEVHDGAVEVYGVREDAAATPDETTERLEGEGPAEAPERGRGRILVIDDSEVVLRAVVDMLELMGHECAGFRSGKEGVKYYREHWQEIALVILDMTMPEMDGRDCFRALKEINPEVKVLLSTGHPLNGEAQELLDDGMAGLVQKPFVAAELSSAVKEALAALAARGPAQARGARRAEGSESDRSGEPFRVLVVDDEDIARRKITQFLETMGCEVVSTSNAEEAISAFLAGEFDLVTLDLMMPGIDGVALQRVLSQEFGAGERTTGPIPKRPPRIVILTAYAEVPRVIRGQSGESILGVVHKHSMEEDLGRIVRYLMAGRRAPETAAEPRRTEGTCEPTRPDADGNQTHRPGPAIPTGEATVEAQYTQPFVRETIRTFQLMSGVTPNKVGEKKKESIESTYELSGVVWISGPGEGAVVLSFPRDTACRIVSELLCDQIEELTLDVENIVAELVNIVTARARRALSERGLPGLGLSLPHVIVGKGRAAWRPRDLPCRSVAFVAEGFGPFCVEISLRPVEAGSSG